MCVSWSPVPYLFVIVIIEVHLQRFSESVSQIDLGKSTSPVEIGSPSSMPLNAVKGAKLGSALSSSTVGLISK